jgi:hypothetical protein
MKFNCCTKIENYETAIDFNYITYFKHKYVSTK